MSPECFKMYADYSKAQDSTTDSFNLAAYQALRSVRDEFADMRGENYEIELEEMVKKGDEEIDLNLFTMYDFDESLEVTWDEYCVGTDKELQL